MKLRAKTIKYSKEKRSKLRNEEKPLQDELQELDQKSVTTMSSIRLNYKGYTAQGGKRLYLGPRQNGSNKKEANEIIFQSRKKHNCEKKLIREVKLENGEVISNFTQVNKEIENFYGKIYTSKISGNNTSDLSEHNHNIHKFMEGFPQLNVEE